MTVRRIRHIIFLKDILLLAITAFGGPQGHFAMYIQTLVRKRGYLTEEELIELYALCQVLPGPTSTQTITAVGFRIGGPNLAYLTLLVWMFPAVLIMTSLAIFVSVAEQNNISLHFLRFLQPIAVGIVAFSSYKLASKVINTRIAFVLMIISAIASYLLKSPFAFPTLIILGGIATMWKYKSQPKEVLGKIKIEWSNLILFFTVLILAATIGGVTGWLPIRLFENFYRNGSLIFGGGQVLVPLLYTEFVEFKKLLTSSEFTSGYGFVQAIPGPVFSFSAYVGALSMQTDGIGAQITGAVLSAIGVFLPGTFLIFFVIRFWEQLKKHRIVKASLEGINAVSAGMVIAATFLLLKPIEINLLNYALIFITIILLLYTRIRVPFIILGGLLLGLIIG